MYYVNIFPIENIEEITFKYRIYVLKGLTSVKNPNVFLTKIAFRLSSLSRSPCIPHKGKEEYFIIQRINEEILNERIEIEGITIEIEVKSEENQVHFNNINEKTEGIFLRFLRFYLQKQISNKKELWQPRSGYPFYFKHPSNNFNNFNSIAQRYDGFTFRIIRVKNRIGIAIDLSSKYVSREFLPKIIDRKSFDKHIRGKKCIYHYGINWYEVKIAGFDEVGKLSEKMIDNNVNLYTKLKELWKNDKYNFSNQIISNGSIMFYNNYEGEKKHIPSGLCKLTYSTNHPDVLEYHQKSALNPNKRMHKILKIRENYFSNLKFGDIKINFSNLPYTTNELKFNLPNLRFGNNFVLIFKKTSKHIEYEDHNVYASFRDFGKAKKKIFRNPKIGIYKKDKFDRHYFILPKEIYSSYWDGLKLDFIREFRRIHGKSVKFSYNPKIVKYNISKMDSKKKIVDEIKQKITTIADKPGYGVILIPRKKNDINEDHIANYLMNFFRNEHKPEIQLSVIHADIFTRFKNIAIKEKSISESIQNERLRSKYLGYIQNVFLNKILLLHNKWPFILESQLKANLTIGIDVKGNTAGFTFIGKTAKNLRFVPYKSEQKERLGEKQLCSIFKIELKEESKFQSEHENNILENIVIHRDGRIFEGEKRGIKMAIELLKKEGALPKNSTLTIVEIGKTSRKPIRIFKKELIHNNIEKFTNPSIGSYILLSNKEGFICNTGYPHIRNGTAQPLHIIKNEGTLTMNNIIHDIWYLSNLTWTNIESCVRLPISIKMADIRLREIAGKFDQDEFEYGEIDG